MSHPSELSTLDRIRRAEEDAEGRIAAARRDAEVAVSQARQEAEAEVAQARNEAAQKAERWLVAALAELADETDGLHQEARRAALAMKGRGEEQVDTLAAMVVGWILPSADGRAE